MFVHMFGVDTIGIRAAKLGGKQINLRAIVHTKSVVCSSNEIEANLQAGPETIIRPVNFYFYDESEPSLVIIWRIGLSCLNLNLKLMYRPPKSNRLSGRICTLSVIQNFLEATQFLQGLPPVSSCPRSDLSQRLSFRHP